MRFSCILSLGSEMVAYSRSLGVRTETLKNAMVHSLCKKGRRRRIASHYCGRCGGLR